MCDYCAAVVYQQIIHLTTCNCDFSVNECVQQSKSLSEASKIAYSYGAVFSRPGAASSLVTSIGCCSRRIRAFRGSGAWNTDGQRL
jgi:hypothetical protein